jgi:hypothetical protein
MSKVVPVYSSLRKKKRWQILYSIRGSLSKLIQFESELNANTRGGKCWLGLYLKNKNKNDKNKLSLCCF